jgi:hypothetical protein
LHDDGEREKRRIWGHRKLTVAYDGNQETRHIGVQVISIKKA